MSGEYRSTVTGSEPVELKFSPEAPTFTIKGARAPEVLAQTAHTAMLLKATIVELAAARARIEEVERERDRLRALPPMLSVEAEQFVEEPADDGLPEQLGTEDIAEQPALLESDEMPAAGSVDPTPPDDEPELPAATEEEEPADPVSASAPAAETKPSREEVRQQSWLIQTEVIREIMTHEDMTREGRLDGHNISAIIRRRVQVRTGISDKQWSNTWGALRQRKLIVLYTYPNNIKLSYAVNLNLELLAEAIKSGKLFTKKEDDTIKETILDMQYKKANPDEKAGIATNPKLASPSPSPSSRAQMASKPQAAASAPVAATPIPAVPSSRSPYTSPPARSPAALPKSGRQRRQEEYDKRQREESAAWAAHRNPATSRAARRNFAEGLVGDAEVILPDYNEIKEELWEAITDNDVRFLLGLTSDQVRRVEFTAHDQLLAAAVKAARLDLSDSSGQYDPKKLSAIIKSLKNIPQPRISFEKEDGKYTLGLTKEGRVYLANQLRQIQLRAFRKKEAQARLPRSVKAA